MNKLKAGEKVLIITWKRLVVEKNTCPRCQSTENELKKAVLELKKMFIPQNLEIF